MQLIDKDLLSMQEVRELVEAAKVAQQELATMDQAQVDRIVRAIADAGVRNARRLAQMAHEDTGFGIVDDKVIKNVFASQGVYEHIKNMKTIGEISRDDAKRLRTIAVPVGVIAGLIPSTNPTSTALYKAEIAIKAGNAIVFSPHPTALRCILETVKVIRQAIAEAGGNENLVSCITIPTMEATDNLMRHRDVAMILATGGSAMVRAAYSSGTPAIGVGPNMTRWMTNRMLAKAKERQIPYQLEVMSGHTGTNGWEMQISRDGVATSVLSLPLKYMHSPIEVLSLADMEQVAALLVAFTEGLGKEAARR